VAELARRGELDRTLVILVSDHGESLGEHALYGHGRSVSGVLIEVPLILRHPPRFPPGRTARPVDLRDLFPTILDVAGVSLRDGEGAMGCSLADAERACPEVRPLVSERLPQAERHKLEGMRVERVIELDGHRLVRHDGEPVALYDISRDPGETDDLREALPERVHALETALDAWIEATPRYEPSPRREAFRRSLDPEMIERLQALGYF
jgi:arylsulfatase A-like enzyme